MAEPFLQPLNFTALREACPHGERETSVDAGSAFPFFRHGDGSVHVDALVLHLRFLQAQWNYTYFIWILPEDGNHTIPQGTWSVSDSVSLSLPAGRDRKVRSRITFSLSLTCAYQAQRHLTSLSIPSTLPYIIVIDADIREITVQNDQFSPWSAETRPALDLGAPRASPL